MAEITKKAGEEAVDEETHEKVKIVVQSLVEMMDEATKIVDFFEKWDEKKRFKKKIKRAVIEEFDDSDLVKPVTDRFIELAEVKFK
jgi:type I restriction enzyme R subunit